MFNLRMQSRLSPEECFRIMFAKARTRGVGATGWKPEWPAVRLMLSLGVDEC